MTLNSNLAFLQNFFLALYKHKNYGVTQRRSFMDYLRGL